MNRKTGEFSAADMKGATAGRKERADKVFADERGGDGGMFVCNDCSRPHPLSESGEKCGDGDHAHRCKACVAKRAAITDPNYRTKNGSTLEGYRRGMRKRNAKSYKSGKLPKWMFS